MTSDTQLRSRLRDVPGFVGVFAADKLPADFRPGQTLIANCDNTGMPGSHWIAMARDPSGKPLFFCSYGLPPDKQDPYLPIVHKTYFRDYLARFGPIQYNNEDFEGLRSDTCGEWAALWILSLHELPPDKWSPTAIEQVNRDIKNLYPVARDEMCVELVGIRRANSIPEMICARRRGNAVSQPMAVHSMAAH